jgi:hypothetical protein
MNNIIAQIIIFLIIIIIISVVRYYINNVFVTTSNIRPIPNDSIKKDCSTTKINCRLGSDDCKKNCVTKDEDTPVSCFNLKGDSTSSMGVCVSEKDKPVAECNFKNGGVWEWTGIKESENMLWECVCMYPEIAGGTDCGKINSNVCSKGTWTYDATISSSPPSVDYCKCDDNYTKILSNDGVPMCVRSKFCESPSNCYYKNSEVILKKK